MLATVTTYAIALLLVASMVESFFAPNMQIGEVSMANVFKQFRESKISASILIESGSKSASLKSSFAAEEKVAILDPAIDTALMVFIVESKTCGATTCINTDSMATLLPETRIAVISCDEDEEDISTERIIDLAALTFDVTNTRRVRRSSLGAGIALAMKLTEDAFKYGVAERVVMVVIADGAAKSIIRNPVDLCGTDALNSDLIDSAMSMQLKAKELTLAGFKFKSVIIDNSESEISEVEWTEGGTRLAAASGAEYYHIPELTGSGLRSVLSDLGNAKL